ncbi:hypothetical protein PAHAL_6G076600 [Panicum hallii]|uniref:Knottin scorpion toxin-like domain-containing protein n=1 Tax=Panicum hallii TaxID=206008 RepID=A0A2T8IFL4_9POAL|nr:hypothetical protein PAHAL_6G076600 [Panicum hallii]
MVLIKDAAVVFFVVSIISSMSPCCQAGGCHGCARPPRSPSLLPPPSRKRSTPCIRASFEGEFCRDEMCTPECASHGHTSSNAYCKSLKRHKWECCCPTQCLIMRYNASMG